MSDSAPVVYLLHGEDDFAIAQFVAEIESKLGDASLAEMNTTRLDNRTFNPDDLLASVSVMPFLTKRRLVVLTQPLSRLTSPTAREKFKAVLDQVPPTTALVIIEYRQLTDVRDLNKGKVHWLEQWAQDHPNKALVRYFPVPKGPAMGRWIQSRAKTYDGQFTTQAAEMLGSYVGDDPRVADQEIQKLLAYVNYQRPVEMEDVHAITPESSKLEDFALVNALRDGDGRKAMNVLQKSLLENDPLQILGGIVYQFRLLLLARSVLDTGGTPGQAEQQLVSHLKIHRFPAQMAVEQARRFSSPVLEHIFRELLAVDEAIKTGEMEGNLALHQLVTQLTER